MTEPSSKRRARRRPTEHCRACTRSRALRAGVREAAGGTAASRRCTTPDEEIDESADEDLEFLRRRSIDEQIDAGAAPHRRRRRPAAEHDAGRPTSHRAATICDVFREMQSTRRERVELTKHLRVDDVDMGDLLEELSTTRRRCGASERRRDERCRAGRSGCSSLSMAAWTALTGVAGWYALRGGDRRSSASAADDVVACTTSRRRTATHAGRTVARRDVDMLDAGVRARAAADADARRPARPRPVPQVRDVRRRRPARAGRRTGEITRAAAAAATVEGRGRARPRARPRRPGRGALPARTAQAAGTSPRRDSNLLNAELIRDELVAMGYEVYLTREGAGARPGRAAAAAVHHVGPVPRACSSRPRSTPTCTWRSTATARR